MGILSSIAELLIVRLASYVVGILKQKRNGSWKTRLWDGKYFDTEMDFERIFLNHD